VDDSAGEEYFGEMIMSAKANCGEEKAFPLNPEHHLTPNPMTRSLPLTRPSRASAFGRFLSLLPKQLKSPTSWRRGGRKAPGFSWISGNGDLFHTAKTIPILLLMSGFFAMGAVAFGQTNSNDAAGLYEVSSTGSGEAVKASDGSMVRLGKKSEIRILKAHISSLNNANTSFQVYLDTSDYPVDPKTGALTNGVVLRVGERAYTSNGGGGKTGLYDSMMFLVSSREEAEAVAKGLGVDCILRAPPGYKFLARFVPAQAEFRVGEPVRVKFSIQNLDDRMMVFQKGGSQRGARDNQYGFRAMLYLKPVLDTGDAMNFGGMCTLVKLEPGKEFSDEIDLKKWFSFEKPGNYEIHGFYSLAFYPSAAIESMAGWDLMWVEYAAADFEVVVK
jgi:hypothetical protein